MSLVSFFLINLEAEGEDVLEPPKEPMYAGVTARWLRETITAISRQNIKEGYKKHKAAVEIQAQYRGYMQRKENERNTQAAISIQRTWRGYVGRQRYYRILATELIDAIKESYVKAAILIQANYRGFVSRKYIHDHVGLKKFQLAAAQELLYCVAIKTRDYLRNHELPGVYTLRNSKCLSKIEKLIALTRLKFFNKEVRDARTLEIAKLKHAFTMSLRYSDRTELPYGSCNDPREPPPVYSFYLSNERRKENEKRGSSQELSELSMTLYKQRKAK